jgi:hypothetical protein
MTTNGFFHTALANIIVTAQKVQLLQEDGYKGHSLQIDLFLHLK